MVFPRTTAEIRDQAQQQFCERLKQYKVPVLISRMNDTTDVRNHGGKGYATLPPQPADFLVKISGFHLFLAEVKGTINEKGFRFKGAFERDQEKWIRTLAFMDSEEMFVFVRSFHLDKWFKIPPPAVENYMDRDSSVPFERLIQDGYEWNPSPLP